MALKTETGNAWHRAVVLALVLGLGLATPCGAAAAPSRKDFRDPVDGALDSSQWLLNKRGFLPIPILMTEPALGYGGGAALLFFHRSESDRSRSDEDPDTPLGLPPSISFGFGFGTEKSSWGAGGGHFGSWRKDTIRYLGAGGYMSLNLDFFVADQAFAYNIEGGLLLQELLFRLFDSNFFVGGRYVFSRMDSTPRGISLPGPVVGEGTDTNSGIGLIGRYDSRDNIFTPNRGIDASIIGTFYSEALGSDSDHQNLEAKLLAYYPLFDEQLVLGMKVRAQAAFDDPPFYLEPYVQLRGVQALRYQDRRAGEAELELRWRVWRRVSLIGFSGVGWISGPKADQEQPGAVPAGGVGFRYLVARLLHLHVGMDVGFSSGSQILYIQTGGAW